MKKPGLVPSGARDRRAVVVPLAHQGGALKAAEKAGWEISGGEGCKPWVARRGGHVVADANPGRLLDRIARLTPPPPLEAA